MSSNGQQRRTHDSTRVSRVGDGYAVIGFEIYIWDESLDEACVSGAEIGALPGHRAWRRGPNGQPLSHPANARRPTHPTARPQ